MRVGWAERGISVWTNHIAYLLHDMHERAEFCVIAATACVFQTRPFNNVNSSKIVYKIV